jgi:uncharacterized protein
LAHQIEFYRREMKSAWWEFFRLNDLDDNDLLNERKGISGLQFIKEHPATKRVPIHSYRYPQQEISLDIGKDLFEPKGNKIGSIYDFSLEERIVHIKKTGATAGIHANSLFIGDIVPTRDLVPSLFRFAQEVIDVGIDGEGAYRAGRDLLMKRTLRGIEAEDLERKETESLGEYSLRLVENLDTGVLPVQGPPGTGKTYLGGGLIAELARQGKKVGVTAVSHKVIRNLLDMALERSRENGSPIVIRHKGNSVDEVTFTKSEDALTFLHHGAVVGGRAWLWANDSLVEGLD